MISSRPRRPGFQEARHPRLPFWAAPLLALTLLAACSSSRETQHQFGTSHQKLAAQLFCLSADSATVITGSNGFILAVAPGAFMDSLGNPVHGNLLLQLREARTMPQILGAGLETRAGNKLLATNGMYSIDAFAGGKRLRVNPDVGLYAFFPTDKKDPAMGLYSGENNWDKLDWKLIANEEYSIPDCGSNEERSKKKCKRCEYLVNKMGKLKPGKKLSEDNDRYWRDRYYWENGVMYFFSSGKSTPVYSQQELDDCKDWLNNSAKGRKLLAMVEEVKKDQAENAGDYYAYRLQNMGWYNIDKIVKSELVSFNGLVTGSDGKPVSGAQVHLLCTDEKNRIHVVTTADDGTFTMEFIAGQDFVLYAHQRDQVGRIETSISKTDNAIARINIGPVPDGNLDEFMKALL